MDLSIPQAEIGGQSLMLSIFLVLKLKDWHFCRDAPLDKGGSRSRRERERGGEMKQISGAFVGRDNIFSFVQSLFSLIFIFYVK